MCSSRRKSTTTHCMEETPRRIAALFLCSSLSATHKFWLYSFIFYFRSTGKMGKDIVKVKEGEVKQCFNMWQAYRWAKAWKTVAWIRINRGYWVQHLGAAMPELLHARTVWVCCHGSRACQYSHDWWRTYTLHAVHCNSLTATLKLGESLKCQVNYAPNK